MPDAVVASGPAGVLLLPPAPHVLPSGRHVADPLFESAVHRKRVRFHRPVRHQVRHLARDDRVGRQLAALGPRVALKQRHELVI